MWSANRGSGINLMNLTGNSIVGPSPSLLSPSGPTPNTPSPRRWQSSKPSKIDRIRLYNRKYKNYVKWLSTGDTQRPKVPILWSLMTKSSLKICSVNGATLLLKRVAAWRWPCHLWFSGLTKSKSLVSKKNRKKTSLNHQPKHLARKK